MREIRIGIVGLGFGTAHAETIANIDGLRVAAVADNAPMARGKKMSVADYAASIGAAAYSDGVKMIEEADIDAVDLVVAPQWREPLLVAAAKRKLPALMEKPMANNVAQAQRFARIASEAGIALMMEYPMRFHPAMQRMKALLYDGPLGKPLSVTAELQTMWNPQAGHWCWAQDVDGGAITECGCHLLDTVCSLCGRPTEVFAVGGNFKGHGKTVDSAALTIQFENGSHALANAGGLGSRAFNVPMCVKVYAENGEALASGANWVYHKVAWALCGPNETLREEALEGPPRWEILRQNMMAFARVVRGEIAPPCTAEDGLVVQRLIAAMVKSIASGRSESL